MHSNLTSEPDYVLSAQASANAVAPDVTGVDYETAQQNADPDVPINKVRAKVFAPKGNKQTLDPSMSVSLPVLMIAHAIRIRQTERP